MFTKLLAQARECRKHKIEGLRAALR